MRLSDAQWIPATQHQTWDALNDPTVLRHCIPGCTQVERISEREYLVTVHTRRDGVDCSYQGELLVADIDAPNSYTLAFEGKGHAAGLIIGTAQVNLAAKDRGTRLSYTIAAQVGGKLGELDEATVRSSADKIIGSFFLKFIDHAGGLPRTDPPPEAVEAERGLAASRWSWVAVLGVIGVLVTYHFLK